jgi:hypothetical protein
VRTRLLNVALLVALVTAVSRLWLFLGEPPPSLPAVESPAAQPAEPAAGRETKAATAASAPESFDVIVARDLFSPARGVVPPAPAVASSPPPKPVPPPKLTLYGVVILEGEKTAYLQEGTQQGRPAKVRENDKFANGLVKAIRPDGVTFLFGGSEINVPLRTPKDGASAPSPVGQDAAGVTQRPQAPVTFPRRQLPPGLPQGQLPAAGRPTVPPRKTPVAAPPVAVPPVEPGSEVFEEEEFPEGVMPGGDAPGIVEEEPGQ